MLFLFFIIFALNIVILLYLLISLIHSKKKERNNYIIKHKTTSDIECPMCHNNNIITRLPITDPFWGGKVGPKYLINKKKIGLNILHCAPIYVDVCMSCGNVISSYIDVPKEADWIHHSNPFSKQ